MATSFAAKVGLAFSCQNLPKLYPNVDAISTVYVYMQQTSDKPFELVGNTDVQINTNDPEYEKIFYFDYYSRRRQYIRLDVWDVSNKQGTLDKNAKKMGSVTVSLIRLIRLKGQPLMIYLLDEKGESLKGDASITVQAVSIRREKKAPEAPPPPPPNYRFNWRRVKEWVFNEQERYNDWVDIPREEQTEENQRKGFVEMPMEGKTYYDLMQNVLKAAGLPQDPPIPPVIDRNAKDNKKKDDDNEDEDDFDFSIEEGDEIEVARAAPQKNQNKGKKDKKSKKEEPQIVAPIVPVEKPAEEEWVYNREEDPEWDSELEDEEQMLRRMRKEEEMTPKEHALRHMHNTHIMQAFLSMTMNNTTKQLRIISTSDDTYNPPLTYLRDQYLFGAGSDSRCITTLHSHGFVIWPAVEQTSFAEHQLLLRRLREFRLAEWVKHKRGFKPNWNDVSKSCRHCRAMTDAED